MRLLLNDIPSADEAPARIGDPPPKTSDIWFATDSLTRRNFVQLGVATASGIGLAALGLLPTAKQAQASHAGTNGYEIKNLPCPSYATNQNHGCSSNSTYHGCGPSTVYTASCQNNQANHKFGWHKSGQCEWILRKNECTGDGDDGWKWDPGNCGNCCPVVYRCHDGIKRGLQFCNFLDKSVCRWVISCGNC